jgi:hypothetical protein
LLLPVLSSSQSGTDPILYFPFTRGAVRRFIQIKPQQHWPFVVPTLRAFRSVLLAVVLFRVLNNNIVVD